MSDIKQGAVYLNKDGRTIKIEKVEQDNVTYIPVGDILVRKTTTVSKLNTILESGGYKDITQPFSGFFVPKSEGNRIGDKILSPDKKFLAEIIKKTPDTIHVKLSDANLVNSTVYLYAEEGFSLTTLFTSELITELESKFSNNVFEVIGVTSTGSEIKVTVAGKSVNKELLEKIERAYAGTTIYQVKRLTNINVA